MGSDKIYIAIDLKSFYASVECVERDMDPLTTNLVVADPSRTEKTICLAVTPSLKAYGISGRARLFEVVQKVKQANSLRRSCLPDCRFTGRSCDGKMLERDPRLEIDYVIAPPRMAHYMEVSTQIYHIYLKYVAPEDIHVYSIDEVFMDVTEYLGIYRMTARELAMKMIKDVLEETKITATAGIAPNLYLCKVAMDIVAKHVAADKDGVRIAQLDEMSYRRMLWDHKPITDFWRVGKGYARKLEENGICTMGDIARCSLGRPGDFYNEDLLFRLFGVNAELLIDHAWGYEPCTIVDIKAYKPQDKSIGAGQVLHCPCDFGQARLVLKEMADMLALDLVDKGLTASQIVLTVGYDIENLTDPVRRRAYKGAVTTDHYGRKIPKHAHGTIHLKLATSSARLIMQGAMELYDEIVDRNLLIRRLYITAEHVGEEEMVKKQETYEQLSLFTNYEKVEKEREEEAKSLEKEKRLQQAMLDIKKKYGKNAILKGMNLEEGATARERNRQIGGHKA